ncbi:MAG: hypothetical protein [Bacteriophage sp.]|nr:MAG: hypothetical protein [Bacteriophage sp.]
MRKFIFLQENEISLPEEYFNNKVKQNNLSKFINDFNECVKGEFKLLPNQIYYNVHTKLKLKHICGEIVEISAANLMDKRSKSIKTGCRKCRMEKVAKDQRYTTEKFINVLKSKFSYIDEYEFLNEYKDTNTKVKIKHKVCNGIFEIRPRELVQGNYCSICIKNKRSKSEIEVLNYIKSILPNNIKVLDNIRGLLKENKKMELDIYIPKLKIAVEFNGNYWHREELVKDKSFQKVFYCNNEGIRLITISEDEWENKKEITKWKLKQLLNVFNGERIYARKTIIKEVPPKEKNLFLDENHIQGKDKSFINLGLYYNDELVSIMTFSKPRKSLNSKHFELSRYATKKGTNVIGGFSKLLKYSRNYFNEGDTIKTYASLAYSLGELYDNNGFTEVKISKPSYWYFKDKQTKKLFHRFTFNKKEIERLYNLGKLSFFDKNLTEKENMLRNGYYTVLDCGNLVYTYTY